MVGLGSNIEPECNIPRAREILSKEFHVLAESRFIKTHPVGPFQDQPDFLNGAVLLETEFELDALNDALKIIESQLGRKHGEKKYGPRTMDLDIVVWNDKVIDQDVYERDYLKKAIKGLIPGLI